MNPYLPFIKIYQKASKISVELIHEETHQWKRNSTERPECKWKLSKLERPHHQPTGIIIKKNVLTV